MFPAGSPFERTVLHSCLPTSANKFLQPIKSNHYWLVQKAALHDTDTKHQTDLCQTMFFNQFVIL